MRNHSTLTWEGINDLLVGKQNVPKGITSLKCPGDRLIANFRIQFIRLQISYA